LLQHHSLKNCAIISTSHFPAHKCAAEVENTTITVGIIGFSSSPPRAELKGHISRAKATFHRGNIALLGAANFICRRGEMAIHKGADGVRLLVQRPKHNRPKSIAYKGARKQIGASVIAEIISAQRDQIGRRGQSERGERVFFPRGMEINSTRGLRGVRQRRRQPSKTALPSLTNRASALVGRINIRGSHRNGAFSDDCLAPARGFRPNNALHC
jgi:hypothetical protein